MVFSSSKKPYNKEEREIYNLAYHRGLYIGRMHTINECKQLIKARIIDNLGLANATKYGNKNAEQQANSYSTVMKYEIADCVEDLLDDLEQLKEKAMSDEQWKEYGHCNDCRRQNYCDKPCTAHDRRVKREIYDIINEKTGINKIMNMLYKNR